MRLLWLYLAVVFAFTTLLTAQDTYSYSYIPKKVYENQLFPVTIVGPDASPTLTFDMSSTVQPLSTKPLLVKNGNDTFYTFYFKAEKRDMLIPKLVISTADTALEYVLDATHINTHALVSDANFSSVLASKFVIKSQQVSNFDAKNHIVTLELEAYEANLEDMILSNVVEADIDAFRRSGAKVTSEFYAVLPRTQKTLSFSYFNTIKRDFVTLTVPVKVADASVTTQSDLNPKVDAFERLKRYALIFFSFFFFIMFLWKRDFFYLVLGVISIITLLTFYIPHKKVCVKQGAPLYILPSHTSTISMYIDDKLDTMELGIRGNFIKVQTKTQIIGWIKNEDTCKP
jgi:hypothetical protein